MQNLDLLSRISKGNPTTNEKIDNVVNLSPKKITKTATKLKEALEELGTSENVDDNRGTREGRQEEKSSS